MSQGQGGGRPRKFIDAEDMYKQGMEYINDCIENDKHLTITGLAISLDTWRDLLCDYESGKYDDINNKYSDTVKRLKRYVENYAEGKIFGNNPTGAIFALKNYGWKDKQEVESVNRNFNSDITALSEEEIDKQLQDLENT